MTEPSAVLDDLLAGRERFLSFIEARVNDPELAEDILQDSFLKALKAGPDLRNKDRLIPWFFTILRNAVTDTYRRGRLANVTLDPAAFDRLPDSQEEQRQACVCFEALLPSLKPEYADLIRSLDLGVETAEQARGRLGITAANLKVRHHRARQALRRKLEETCRLCAEHHCLDCRCQAGS